MKVCVGPAGFSGNMKYQISFSVFILISGILAAPSSDKQPLGVHQGNLRGSPVVNDDDQLRLGSGISKRNEDDKPILLVDPGEGTHDMLKRLLQEAETEIYRLEHLVQEVQSHEDNGHRVIENLRASAPVETDSCVMDVFGTSNRAHPIYCTVKYFSPVALVLYEARDMVEPLRQIVSTLTNDLTACKNTSGIMDGLICRAQALRDAWENSEFVRAKLNRALPEVRDLVIEIYDCLKTNQPVQKHLVNQVHLCTVNKANSVSL